MMAEKFSNFVREDREKTYTEFYSRFIEDHFRTDNEFVDELQNILDSGEVSLGAFERGNKQGIYQCAYILQFGVHDACLGEEKFRESAAKCEKLSSFCSKERIKICCLGSRSLFAVLGVCKALDEYVEKVKFSSEDRRLVQILIVDKNKVWKVLSEYIVNAAKSEYPSLKLKLDFIVQDVRKDFSETAKKSIELSHVVTMAKYLSNMESEKTVAKITQNTVKDMKKNSVLFYLDHDTRGDFNVLEKQIGDTKSFSQIKSTKSPERYILQDSTKAHHQCLYEFLSPVNTRWDMDTEPMIVSTWIKNPDLKIKHVEEKPRIPVTAEATGPGPEDPDKFFRAKRSSNTKRNSEKTFRLVGKFALMDMEKKNKDNTRRQEAKQAAVSRHANFDDW